MDNFLLKEEAKRVSKELVKIYSSNENLDKLFNKILNKEYKKDSMKVLTYISDALYDLGYTLDSVNPFKLKEI